MKLNSKSKLNYKLNKIILEITFLEKSKFN